MSPIMKTAAPCRFVRPRLAGAQRLTDAGEGIGVATSLRLDWE